MSFFYPVEQDRLNAIIRRDAFMSRAKYIAVIRQKIDEWLASTQRQTMLIGESYYRNQTAIRQKKVQIENRSNAKLAHAFVRKLVDQKVGYLLSKPFSVKTDNKAYGDLLNILFDKVFLRLLMNVGKEAINKGIAWLYVYFDETGSLSFKKIPSHEVIPVWRDNDHTDLDAVIRVYDVDNYDGREKNRETIVELYDRDGIQYFVYRQGALVKDADMASAASHFTMTGEDGVGKPYNWTAIPFIPFKYNEEEQPLIEVIKSLVDDFDRQTSTNADILADIPLFTYILKDYGGADLAEFVAGLKEYRAVKVENGGGVDKLTAEPMTTALQAHLAEERRAIYEFGRGVDTQNESMGNASGVALKFRYADLDMDANILDTEFQASFQKMLWFINQYFIMRGHGDFSDETAEIVFNRDIIISESEVIEDCKNSKGIVSDKTIIANHPWTRNVEEELEQMAAETAETQAAWDAYPTLGEPGADAGAEADETEAGR